MPGQGQMARMKQDELSSIGGLILTNPLQMSFEMAPTVLDREGKPHSTVIKEPAIRDQLADCSPQFVFGNGVECGKQRN
jgi:hypothetical protein